jgi:hypothetical protein
MCESTPISLALRLPGRATRLLPPTGLARHRSNLRATPQIVMRPTNPSFGFEGLLLIPSPRAAFRLLRGKCVDADGFNSARRFALRCVLVWVLYSLAVNLFNVTSLFLLKTNRTQVAEAVRYQKLRAPRLESVAARGEGGSSGFPTSLQTGRSGLGLPMQLHADADAVSHTSAVWHHRRFRSLGGGIAHCSDAGRRASATSQIARDRAYMLSVRTAGYVPF